MQRIYCFLFLIFVAWNSHAQRWEWGSFSSAKHYSKIDSASYNLFTHYDGTFELTGNVKRRGRYRQISGDSVLLEDKEGLSFFLVRINQIAAKLVLEPKENILMVNFGFGFDNRDSLFVQFNGVKEFDENGIPYRYEVCHYQDVPDSIGDNSRIDWFEPIYLHYKTGRKIIEITYKPYPKNHRRHKSIIEKKTKTRVR